MGIDKNLLKRLTLLYVEDDDNKFRIISTFR